MASSIDFDLQKLCLLKTVYKFAKKQILIKHFKYLSDVYCVHLDREKYVTCSLI